MNSKFYSYNKTLKYNFKNIVKQFNCLKYIFNKATSPISVLGIRETCHPYVNNFKEFILDLLQPIQACKYDSDIIRRYLNITFFSKNCIFKKCKQNVHILNWTSSGYRMNP